MSKSVITSFEAVFEAGTNYKVKGVMKVGDMVIDRITDERLSVDSFHVQVSHGQAVVEFDVYSENGYKQSDHRELVKETISKIMEQRPDTSNVDYTIEVDEGEDGDEGDDE